VNLIHTGKKTIHIHYNSTRERSPFVCNYYKLARLNNHRLYARILQYEREPRKKPQQTDQDLDGYGSLKEDDYKTYEQALGSDGLLDIKTSIR
jgi:hypothetical protein